MPNAFDLNLPYVDQFDGNPPQQQQYVRESQVVQQLPCRHQWLPPTGGFGGSMNSLTYGLRIRVEDLKIALPLILGYASPGGLNGNFTRINAITDPDGFGMVATKVGIRGYEGPSGLIKMQIRSDKDSVNSPAPDGEIWNNRIAAEFDVKYTIDPQIGDVLPIYRYVLLDVTFEHALYFTGSDAITNFSKIGERDRYMIWNYVSAIEYVGLDSNTLFWQEGPQAGLTVGKGAGFVRSTGELKGNWYGVPAESFVTLLSKWVGLPPFSPGVPLFPNLPPIDTGYPINGRVNKNSFQIDLTNEAGFITFPEETLLFQPPRTTIRPSPLGFRLYDVEVSLTHRPETWNKFLYWPQGVYYRAAYKSQVFPPPFPVIAQPIYQIADFEDAFKGV